MTSQAVEGTWIRTVGYWRFRGELVYLQKALRPSLYILVFSLLPSCVELSFTKARQKHCEVSFGVALVEQLSLKSFAGLHVCGTAVIETSCLFTISLFTWSSQPREGLAVYRRNVVPSFLSYFKIPSTVPFPRIEPRTSRSAIKRPTDRANPAAVDYYVQHDRSTGPELN